jgi:hypothetical protein
LSQINDNLVLSRATKARLSARRHAAKGKKQRGGKRGDSRHKNCLIYITVNCIHADPISHSAASMLKIHASNQNIQFFYI